MNTSKDMQNRPHNIAEPASGGEEKEESRFFPGGGIAFFILLVVLSLLCWYGIYFLMIERT